jgi:hypothetical protein
MDPNASDTGVALPLAVDTHLIPPFGPRILQLSPIPGNIYKSNCFFYDCTADISRGDFRAVLTFASAQCPDLQVFQVTHPLAIVCPLSEVPLAILAWGGFLLSGGIVLAPPSAAPAPAPLAAKQFGILPAPSSSGTPNDVSDGSQESSSLLTSWSIGFQHNNQGVDTPSLGSTSQVPVLIGGLPAVCNTRIPPRQLPWATNFSHPPHPNPMALSTLPFLWGVALIELLVVPPLSMGGTFLLLEGLRGVLIQRQIFSYPSSGSTIDHWRSFNFLAVFLQRFLLSFMVRALPAHLMGGLSMRLHLWCLHLLLRLPRCIL